MLVAGIVLSAAMVGILGLAARSLNAQMRGEQLQEAALLLDSLLNEVLALGPEAYEKTGSMEGQAEFPFDRFHYRIEIDDQGAGQPFRVVARVFWSTEAGEQTASVQTLIAPRLGEEPDPDRKPTNPIER